MSDMHDNNFKRLLREYLRREVKSIIFEELNEQHQSAAWLGLTPPDKQDHLEVDPKRPLQIAKGDPVEVDPVDPIPPDWCPNCVPTLCDDGFPGCWMERVGGIDSLLRIIYCRDGSICAHAFMTPCSSDPSGWCILSIVWCAPHCEGYWQVWCDAGVCTYEFFACGHGVPHKDCGMPGGIWEDGFLRVDPLWLCEQSPAWCGQDVRRGPNGLYYTPCGGEGEVDCSGPGCENGFCPWTPGEPNPGTLPSIPDCNGMLDCAIEFYRSLPGWLRALIMTALLLGLAWVIAWLGNALWNLIKPWLESEPTTPNTWPTDPAGGGGTEPDGNPDTGPDVPPPAGGGGGTTPPAGGGGGGGDGSGPPGGGPGGF